jgi:hypothetical protein
MATGPLRILDFLNRGAMDRRLGPDWKQKEEDRQLHNSLLVEGNSRADITSALAALDKLDELKTKGLAEDVNMAGAAPMPGESQRDAYIREEAARREELRRATLNHVGAQTELERAQGKALDKNFTVTPDEAAALKKAGVDLTPGAVIDDNVLAAITQLQGHRIQAEASGRSARAMGTPQKLLDEQGNIKGWMFPATGQFVPNTVGGRASGMSTGELDRRGMLNQMAQSVGELRTLSEKNRDSIGVVMGKVSSLKRDTVGVSPEVDDIFHIADNLSDMLLRARSGAQINEQEYNRLRGLVPNPRGPVSKYFDDLRRFETELGQLSAVRNFQVTPTSLNIPGEAPPGGGLQDAVSAFLARRGGR